MTKFYSDTQKSLPKKETISFLLNYSRSLKIIKTKAGKFEIIVN